MTDTDPPPDPLFEARLRDRLADLRLRLDLRELGTPEAFREALELGGTFLVADPRVREACRKAGLARWLP
jgi:hypothetical protein